MPLAVGNRGPSNLSGNLPLHHRIRLVPHLDSRRTLRFEPITRDLKDDDPPLRIGRFTDRAGAGLAAQNPLNSNKLAFKSKVVSRAHAEIWIESGKFFIKDTKSSSGTFLNHLRLAAAGHESKSFQLRDGDILQLGVDYQGGSEDIYKSVKIRVEVGREWQAAANAFKYVNRGLLCNRNSDFFSTAPMLSHNSDPLASAVTNPNYTKRPKAKNAFRNQIYPTVASVRVSLSISAIVYQISNLSGLFAVSIRQALFIAPCSHAFHYKCIKPLLEKHTSAFSCPLCRSFADLEEDVEVEADHEVEEGETDDDDAGGIAGVNRDREDAGGIWEDFACAPVSAPVQSTNTLAQLANAGTPVQRNLLTAPYPSQPRDGAETEVETDMIQSHETHRPRRPRVTVRTEGHIVVPSTMPASAPVLSDTGHQNAHLPLQLPLPHLLQSRDADEEMIDGDLEDGDLHADDVYVRRADPFSPGHTGNSSAAAVVRDDLSEGEGSGSGSAEGALGLGLSLGLGLGMVIESGHDAEGTVSGGKRKR